MDGATELLDSAELAARWRVPESWIRSQTRALTPRNRSAPLVSERQLAFFRCQLCEVRSIPRARARTVRERQNARAREGDKKC